MKKIVGVITLLGVLGFAAAIIQKIIYSPGYFGLNPTAYMKFSAICLLISIALSTREMAYKEK
jgi:hypothetical protein